MKNIENKIVLYTDKNGKVELRADAEKDTLWATQAQIAQIFKVNTRTVNEHIINIFNTRELIRSSTVRKSRIVELLTNSKEQFDDLRNAITFIESKTGDGKVKGKIIVKLTKDVINQ